MCMDEAPERWITSGALVVNGGKPKYYGSGRLGWKCWPKWRSKTAWRPAKPEVCQKTVDERNNGSKGTKNEKETAAAAQKAKKKEGDIKRRRKVPAQAQQIPFSFLGRHWLFSRLVPPFCFCPQRALLPCSSWPAAWLHQKPASPTSTNAVTKAHLSQGGNISLVTVPS